MTDQIPPRWQYFLNPWWRQRRLYFTEVSVEECRRRLTESTTRFLGRQVGRALVSMSDFTLHRVTFYSNGLKPYAYVRLAASPVGGTLVRITMSATLAGRIFFGFWFGFVGAWTLFVLIVVLRHPADGWWSPLIGLGMIAVVLLFTSAGRLGAAGDAAFLEAFVHEQLELQEPPAWAKPMA